MQYNFLKKTIYQNSLAFILILGAAFLLFHDLFFGKIIATNDISTNDLLYFNLPMKTLYSEALKKGELLQWTPYIYGGYPIFAEGQGGFLYPLNLIIWYFLNPIGAMNVYIIIQSLFMGLGVYLFASKITGNKLLSIPSGVAGAICGSIIAGHTRHLNSLTTIAYMPWIFYTIELFLKTKKISKGLILGVLFGLLILIGHPQFAFITGFFSMLYLLLRILFEKDSSASIYSKLKSFKVLNFLLTSLVVTIIVGFPQIKSTLELLPYTERSQYLTSEFTGLGSLPFNGIFTFIYPYYMGNTGNLTFQSGDVYFFWEFFHYCGAITFILAIYGTIKAWKQKEYHSIIRSLLLMAIISYLLALGENLQLYKIFSLFPFTKAFRFPARWLLGTEFSILSLSGFGVISLVNSFSKKTPALESKGKKKTKTSSVNLFKNEIALTTQFKTAILISVLISVEIYVVAGRQVATADPAFYLNPPSFVDKIKVDNKSVPTSRNFTLSRTEFLTRAFELSGGWEGKHDLLALGAKLLPPDLGSYFGVPIIDGYFLLAPSFIYEVWGNPDHGGLIQKTASLEKKKYFQPSEKFVKLSKMFGVKYLTSAWIVPKPYEQIWDSAGIKAYELPDTLRKTWVVSKIESIPPNNDNANADKLISDSFDPMLSAYCEGTAPSLPSESQNGTADILKYDDHSVTIRANVPGFVVINDTWYPRWKAYIDGNEVPVYKTNVMMRGVVAPKAGSIIEMKFDTGNVFLLTILSYITIIISFLFIIFEKIKSNKGS